MLRNFTTADTLAGYVPHLTNLQWTNQDDYSTQIEIADYEVRNDLFNRGLRSVYLRPDLTFNEGTASVTASETSDTVTDSLSRNRWVVNPFILRFYFGIAFVKSANTYSTSAKETLL